MSSVTYEFLQDCSVFFLATIDRDTPALRPFGAVMEYNDELYFSTGNTKAVYAQMIANPNIQIAAIKNGTREGVRISGKAIEVNDLSVKQIMMENCPALLKRFKSNADEHFALFKVTEMDSILNL